MAAGIDIEIAKSRARMCHQGLETSRSETDHIWILAWLSGVDMAAFVEINVKERRVEPVCEECSEASIGKNFVISDTELEEVLAILVDSIKNSIINLSCFVTI